MNVGDTLTYPRVGGDERAFRAKRLLHGDRRPTHGPEDGREEIVRQVVERLDVLPRHHENVPRKERRAIEERDDVVVAMDDVRPELAVSDLTEDARCGHVITRDRRRRSYARSRPERHVALLMHRSGLARSAA